MLLRSADCHCQRRARLVVEQRHETRGAPTVRAQITQALNRCSVKRQLSMTPCPRLTVAVLYWRRAWVDCHSRLNNTGLSAKTEDEQRAVTSANSAPDYLQGEPAQRVAGVCLRRQTRFKLRKTAPKLKACAVVARLSMNWRGGSRLSRPGGRLENIFLAIFRSLQSMDARMRPRDLFAT